MQNSSLTTTPFVPPFLRGGVCNKKTSHPTRRREEAWTTSPRDHPTRHCEEACEASPLFTQLVFATRPAKQGRRRDPGCYHCPQLVPTNANRHPTRHCEEAWTTSPRHQPTLTLRGGVCNNADEAIQGAVTIPLDCFVDSASLRRLATTPPHTSTV